MLVKRKPFEFWNFRDTRKTVPEMPAKPELVPVAQHRTVKGLISHHILLPIEELPEQLLNRLRADLTLKNPDFEKARKYGKGFVSYAIPQFVRLYSMDSKYLALPRSIRLPYLHNRFSDCGLSLELEDIRPEFETVPFPEKGEMTPLFYQHEAIDKILGGNIVLKFRCGKGKTVMALMAVANLRLRTLIMVRTNILLGQWVEAIQKIFDVPEDSIGIINGKTKREGLITVATEQSVSAMPREAKRRIGRTYGHVIIDECVSGKTMVRTSIGWRTVFSIIQDLDKGLPVWVLSYNEETGREEFKRVRRSFKRGKRPVFRVTVERGVSIVCTPDHLFYVREKGWLQAQYLKVGEDILDSIMPQPFVMGEKLVYLCECGCGGVLKNPQVGGGL